MKTLNPISLIILLIGSLTLPAVAHRLAAQTVTWTITPNSHASIDSKTGQVTVTSFPATEQTLKVTATVVQNGKTTVAEKDVVIEREHPCIQAGGVCWAQGNVTYDPSSPQSSAGTYTGLKIADDPYDYGLFFQWFGGSGTGNVIIGYATAGAWNSTPRYVQPGKAYGFPGSYPTTNAYNSGYNSNGVNMGEWTGNNPCTAIAGGGWRMPTHTELKALLSSSALSWTFATHSSGMQYIVHKTVGLIFPKGGFRYHDAGGELRNPYTRGFYWSSTQYDSGNASRVLIESNYFTDNTVHTKGIGQVIRCVAK